MVMIIVMFLRSSPTYQHDGNQSPPIKHSMSVLLTKIEMIPGRFWWLWLQVHRCWWVQCTGGGWRSERCYQFKVFQPMFHTHMASLARRMLCDTRCNIMADLFNHGHLGMHCATSQVTVCTPQSVVSWYCSFWPKWCLMNTSFHFNGLYWTDRCVQSHHPLITFTMLRCMVPRLSHVVTKSPMIRVAWNTQPPSAGVQNNAHDEWAISHQSMFVFMLEEQCFKIIKFKLTAHCWVIGLTWLCKIIAVAVGCKGGASH